MHKLHLFGPVFSRRLGRSLGVDLLPCKTCSLDCIYCECGPTDRLTIERREWVPTAEVKEELQAYLSRGPELDFITLGGCGEPTLHSGLGEIIADIKCGFPGYRLAVLTNSTLLSNPDVRKELKRADLVVPSLDAATEASFFRLNRPHRQIALAELIAGLKALARERSSGQVWLETVIVPAFNDAEEEVGALGRLMQEIAPDRIQVGTLDRPPAEPGVRRARKKELEAVARRLGPVEVVF